MALNPKFAGQRLAVATAANVNTIELYLDYVCPFSKKLFDTVYTSVWPLVKSKYPNVEFIFRQQIQPWHPSSTLVHEAGVAVLRKSPEKFWDFSKALFDKQTEYFDVNVVNESRNDTYKRLAKLAASAGLNEKEIYDLLEVTNTGDGLNVGNKVTNDIKLQVKANRLTGVHVTPTVLFNGVVENGISSSFTKEDWDKWLKENV